MRDPVPSGTKKIPLAGAVLLGWALSLARAEDVHSARILYPNGKVKETYRYRLAPREGKKPDTLLTGERIQWDSTTGRKLYLTTYCDGKPDGVAIDWYPDGAVRLKCFYRSGALDSCSQWDQKGKLLERSRYHGGNDTIFRYDEDGNFRVLIPPGPID